MPTNKIILIVDDEIDMSAMLKRYFELNGYDVSVAENGLQAIEKAGKQPDLILLDINMPDIDGIEVYNSRFCKLPYPFSDSPYRGRREERRGSLCNITAAIWQKRHVAAVLLNNFFVFFQKSL